MPRHKKIAIYTGDWEKIFPALRREGRTLYQYDYSKHDTEPGTIFLAKEDGDEFISIASNLFKKCARGYSKQRRYNRYRIMFRLTDEGWEYLKGVLLEETF